MNILICRLLSVRLGMISERFKTWWEALDDTEKCNHIKNWGININKAHKKMLKATQREVEFGFNRTGVRGGRFTTLNAQSQNTTSDYLDLVDDLKYMIGSL